MKFILQITYTSVHFMDALIRDSYRSRMLASLRQDGRSLDKVS